MRYYAEFLGETCVAALILAVILYCLGALTGCTDAHQRRILQCRLATVELEDAQRELRKAMIAGTVKYAQLDRVEGAIGDVNRCVLEFATE